MAGQNPFLALIGRISGGAPSLALLDAQAVQLVGRGLSRKLNMTAANVIKAAPGRLVRVIVIAPGTTSGAFTFNDCAATGDAAAANAIWSILFNGTANVVGATFDLDIPCTTGIVLSAVPGAGSPIIAAVYS